MKKKIIFLLISLSFLIFPAFSSWAYVSFDQVFDEIDKHIIEPTKQKFNSFRNSDIIDEVQEKAKEKQKELIDKAQEKAKETTKSKIKNFFRNRLEQVKRILNPLKIKIQEGSDVIRREVDRVKNYLKNIF